MNTHMKLSPSDLTFLWDECPRCFYLKVALGFRRPSAPFPSIFGRIDGLMKAFFSGQPAQEVAPGLPDGRVMFAERWVESEPIVLPGHGASCFIRGKFDSVLQFDDGSYAIIDFKTSQARAEHIPFYGRQLHAYAYALEHPGPGKLGLAPVTRLGLFSVEPVGMDRTPAGQIAYLGDVTWMEIPKDEGSFLGFIDQVLYLLEQPEPPQASEKCSYCNYRQAARESGH